VTRRYDVEIALPSGLAVYPGMFGRAPFIIGTDAVVMVPDDAIVERGGLIFGTVVSSALTIVIVPVLYYRANRGEAG